MTGRIGFESERLPLGKAHLSSPKEVLSDRTAATTRGPSHFGGLVSGASVSDASQPGVGAERAYSGCLQIKQILSVGGSANQDLIEV